MIWFHETMNYNKMNLPLSHLLYKIQYCENKAYNYVFDALRHYGLYHMLH
jgi:hypothetical protein